jgi:hypothetical protein
MTNTSEAAAIAGDDDEITEIEARLLEAFGPLEMARIIATFGNELAWLATFANVRSQDDSKTFARVNRGALRTIAERANAAISKVTS